jgi:hypothetical protein
LVGRRPISEQPSAPSCLDLACKWLNTCYFSHNGCSTNHKTIPRLPTRVIDLGSSFESIPVLYDTRGAKGHWVTLSHCWGKEQPLKTTSQSLHAHQSGIPVLSIPRLFQDAIYITRVLKLRYLWIDSLCIIQDSQVDWRTESADMGRIYSDSVLTIASYTTSSSKESLFDPTLTARWFKTPTVCIPCQSSQHNLKGSLLLQFDYQQDYQDHGPLANRAWALQEDVLSTRVLKWTAQQLRWQCRTMECTESYPDGYYGDAGVNHGRFISLAAEALASRRSSERLQNRPTSELFARNLWYNMIEDFASRGITYETDKYAATAGIAQEVARHTGFNYRAGLWLEDLHFGLLWYLPRVGKKTTAYVAPSWSWASINPAPTLGWKSALCFQSVRAKIKQHLVDFLSIETTCVNSDTYSQVTSGTLVVRGKCFSIEDSTKVVTFENARDSKCKDHLMGGLRGIFDSYKVGFGTIVYCLDTLTTIPLELSNAIILQICRFSLRHCLDEGSGKVFGLVLLPTGVRNGEYMRLGIVRISDELTWGWETRILTII